MTSQFPSSTLLGPTTKEHVQRSIEANKDHQTALKTYAERLEAELGTLDKLLAAIEVNDDDEPDLDVGGFVSVPGSTRATAPISFDELLSEESPFFEDAERRQRYLDFTGYHPMKAKELEDLAEAVRTENYRLYALQAQRRGQFSFADLASKSARFLEQNKDEIDWERVAFTISSKSQSHVHRTSKECEIRWLGDRHPDFNHGPWQPIEITQCKALVSEFSPGLVDWTKVAEQLSTHRTPLDCMRHGIIRRTHVWTPEADQKLLDAIQTYGLGNWLIVARIVSQDATAQQCQNRFQRTLDPELKRGPWSPSEDAQLRLGVEAYGNSWLDVASTIEGRNNEQCRDRWNEKLDPKINRNVWTDDEDGRLLEAVREVGEGKWKAVSVVLGNGRKDSACRTRYEALKKRKGKGKAVDLDVGSDGDAESSRPKSRRRNRRENSIIDDRQADISTGLRPAKTRPRPRKTFKGKEKEARNVCAASSEDGDGMEHTRPGVLQRPKRQTRIKKSDGNLETGGIAEGEQEQGETDIGASPEKGKNQTVHRDALEEGSSVSARKSIPHKRRVSGKAPDALANGTESDETRPRKKRRSGGTLEKSNADEGAHVGTRKDTIGDGPETGPKEIYTQPSRRRGRPPKVQAVRVAEEDLAIQVVGERVPEMSNLPVRSVPRKRGRPLKVRDSAPAGEELSGNTGDLTVQKQVEFPQDHQQGDLELRVTPDSTSGPPRPEVVDSLPEQASTQGNLPTRGRKSMVKVVPTRKQPGRAVSHKETE